MTKWSRQFGHVRAGLLASLLAAAVLVGGCGSDDSGDSNGSSGGADTTAAKEVTSTKLVLPYPPGPFDPATTMAKDRFFEQNDLDVEIVSVDGSSVVVQEIIAGKADFGYASSVAVLTANAKGADLRGLYTVSHDAAAILSVPADSDVQDLADMKGKTIGVTSLSDGSVPIVNAALRDSGLKAGDDVRLVVVGHGGPAVAQSLKSGRIDAYAAGADDVAVLKAKGEIELRSIMPEKYVGLPDTVFVTTQEVLDDPARRDVAISMAKALNEAAAFAKDDTPATLDAACQLFAEQCQDMAVAEASLRIGADVQNPLPGQDAGFMDPEKLQVYVDALAASDQISGDVDIEESFPNTYIDQIKPSA